MPHEVPSATFDPESTQVGAPVVGSHVVEPTWHGFVGWQLAPALHAQVPEWQVRPSPHGVPSAADPVTAQLAAPVVGSQLVVPTLHGFVGSVQVTPAAQAHTPAVQVRPSPQDVPSGTGVAVATQTFVPVSQEERPWRHGFEDGLQAMPALQTLHAPLSQTWFVPQDVPFATAVPVSLQTGPAEHVSEPTSHGFAGVQDVPATHAVQTPALQTSFVPQAVPSGTLPVSVHTGEPEPHA